MAGSFDGISIRATKFAIKSYIPIIGGYLSDGLDFIVLSSILRKDYRVVTLDKGNLNVIKTLKEGLLDFDKKIKGGKNGFIKNGIWCGSINSCRSGS